MSEVVLGIRIAVNNQGAARILGQTRDSINRVDAAASNASHSMHSMNSSMSETIGNFALFSVVFSAVNKLLAAPGNIISTADNFTLLDARIKIATASIKDYKKASQSLIDISLRTHSSLSSNIQLFARMNKSVIEVTGSQESSLNVVEALNNAIKVSGASAGEASSLTIQLSQAFSSGVLRGDEFNSVMENGSRIVDALTAATGKSRGELRKLAEQGKLTSELVVLSLSTQSAAIKADVKNIPLTIGFAFENLRTQTTLMINDLNKVNNITGSLAKTIKFLGDNIVSVVSFVGSSIIVFTGMAAGLLAVKINTNLLTAAVVTNRSIYTGAIITTTGATGATNLLTAAQTRLTAALMINPFTGLMVSLGALIGLLSVARKDFIDFSNMSTDNKIQSLKDSINKQKSRLGTANFLSGILISDKQLATEKARLTVLESSLDRLERKKKKAANNEADRDTTNKKRLAELLARLNAPVANDGITNALKRQDDVWKQLITDANKLDALRDSVAFTNYLAKLAEELDAQGKTNEEIRKRIALERDIQSIRANNPDLSQGQATDIATQKQAAQDRITALTSATNTATESANAYADQLLQIDNNLTNIRTSGQDAFGGMDKGLLKLVKTFSNLSKSLLKYSKDIKTNKKAWLDYEKNTKDVGKKKSEEIGKFAKRETDLTKAQTTDAAKQMGGVFDALSGLMKKNSVEQKVFAIAAIAVNTALAVVDGVRAVLAQGEGDPYSAFARIAAMASIVGSILAGIGAATNIASAGGGGSGGPSITQKTQGTGTVKGDSKAISNSINESIKLLSSNSSIDLSYSLRTIGLLSNIDGNTKVLQSSLSNIQYKFPKLNPSFSKFMSWIGTPKLALQEAINSSTFRMQLSDYKGGNKTASLYSGRTSLGNEINTFSQGGSFDKFNALNFKQTPYLDNTKNIMDMADAVRSLLSATMSSIVDTVSSSSASLIPKTEWKIKKLLLDSSVNLGNADFSKLTGDKLNEAINGILSKFSDNLSLKIMPSLVDFQQSGEGAFQTLVRVSTAVDKADSSLSSLGITAVSYTDVANKQAEISGQIFNLSVQRSNTDKNIKDAMVSLNSKAEEQLAIYKTLIETQHQLIIAGQGLNVNLSDLTKGFGGDAAGALKTYNEYFIKDTKRLASEVNYLTAAFNRAGYQLPKTKQQFVDLFKSLDDTGKGRLLAAQDQWTAAFDLYTSTTQKAANELKTVADIINKISLDNARVGASSLQKELYSLQDSAVQTIATVLANGGKLSDVMIVFNNAVNNGNIAIQKAKDTIHKTFSALYASIDSAMLAISDNIVKILTPDNLANVQKSRAYSVLNDQSASVKDRIKAANTLNKLILKGYTDQKKAIDKIAAASKQLLTYVDSLKVNSQLSTFSNKARLGEAKAQFLKQLGLAQGGDSAAAQGLSGFATTYLNEAKGYFASGKDYASIFNNVTSSLTDFAGANIDPATQTAQATQKTVTELQAIKATLNAIKSQQSGLESSQVSKLNSDAALIVKQFSAAIAALDKMSATVKRDLQVTLKGTLSESELTLLTKLYSKNPNTIFTATLNATLSGALSKQSGLSAFDNFFKADPNSTFNSTLNAVKSGALTTNAGIQLFNRMFSADSIKTFSAVLSASKSGALSNQQGVDLFNRMLTKDSTRTLTAILAAYHGGELSKQSGLVLFDRMFSVNPNNTYSAVLNAVKSGALSSSGGETLFNRMFQKDPALTATKTIDVKKGVWNATAASIAESGMTGSTSTVTVSSTLTLDSVLNNSILSYSKVDVANIYNRIATATERSGNFLSSIYNRLWNIEVYTEATRTYTRGLYNAAAGGAGFTVHSEYRNGNLATFAKGGVTNEASIFGEAGWEAAVPLPDGKTIPVTIQSQPSGIDAETKQLLEQVLSELRAANNQRGQIAMTTIKQNSKIVQQSEAQTRAAKRQAVAV